MVVKNIFDVSPEDSKGAYTDSYVGRIRAGFMDGRNPRSLEKWRVTTDDPDVAEAISTQYGGTAQEWDNEREPVEVFTDAASFDVTLEPGAIRTGFAFFGRNSLIRKCDGQTQTWGDEQGKPCPCATLTLEERKEKGKQGVSCQPDISVSLRLRDLPNLGLFRFQSGSWVLLKDIGKAEEIMLRAEAPRNATISLEKVVMKNGREFTKCNLVLK